MYRQETEKRHQDALIECFSEDFSRLDQQEQELMKQDLMNELEECRKKLASSKGKTRAKLEKDIELFSILAKELGIDCMDSDRVTSDLDLINQALQKATDNEPRENDEKETSSQLDEKKSEEEIIAEFSDSDFWAYFANYCKEQGITRADGKEISWRGWMDTSVDYLDKDGNLLKLKYLAWWADQHDDTGAATNYVLVKGKSSRNKWEDKVKAAEDKVKAAEGKVETPEDQVKVPEELTWTYDFNLSASLSEMENIHLENARYAVEDALRAEYDQVSKRNVFKKAGLFLQRGRIRRKRIAELMEKNTRLPFTDDEKLNNTLVHATNRHETEKQLWLWNIEWTEVIDIPEVNQLAQDYIEGETDDSAFEARFNELLQHNDVLSTSVKDISHLGTNILQKLKVEKAQYQLVSELAQTLEAGTSTEQVQAKIEEFLKNYQKTPDFLKDIQADLNEKNLEKLKSYFKHQKAIRAMALKNLKMKLSVFTGGKSAYQIDNTDRENGWVHKLGKKLDKIPRYVQVPGYMGLGAVVGLAGGPLGLWVVGTSILTTSTFAGTTGFMNFVKKRTHHTKEQNTHEKDLTRDYDNQQKLIQQWKDATMKKGAKNWFKRYKAQRQLELYDQTTQQNMVKTKEVNEALLAFATSLRPLSDGERQNLLAFVMGAKARLQAYWETGHNFLASNSREEVESDMDQLHQALLLAADKLGISFEEINNQTIKKSNDEAVSYQDMLKELQTDYASASKKFKNQRAWLATKYGIGTAALSAGTALWLQALMWTGVAASDATVQHSEVARQLATSDHFWLWSHELVNGNQIQDSVAEQLKNLTDAGDKVMIHYGSGTDATLVKAGSLLNDPSAYQAKLEAVADQIKNLNLTSGQKSAFLDELAKKSWELDWSKAFTNDYLQGDRCAEGLLQMAKGLEASGNTTLIPELSYDTAKSIAWSALHNSWERLFTAGMQITDATASEVAWSGSTWRVPITGFFNTFKDKKLEEQDYEQKEKKSDVLTEENLQHDSLADSAIASSENSSRSDWWPKIIIPRGSFDAPNTESKSKEGARSFWEKTKEESSEFSEKFKEKYHEKAPIVKEKSKQAWEKTKELSKKWAIMTKNKVKALKNKLFDKNKESTDQGIESGFEAFDNYPKSKETLAFLNNNSTVHITQDHERVKFKWFIPNQHLSIAWRDVYLTPLLEWHYVVAYVEDNGELVPRVFRKSSSGGNWHAVPWYDGSRVSKGEFVSNISYEKWTVVTKEFNQILDALPDENIWVNMQDVMKKIYGKDIPGSANFNGEKEYKNMPKSAQEYYDETVVFGELLGEWNPNTTRDSVFKNYENTDQIKELYDKLNLEKRMDFSSSQIVESYASHHKYLWDIENQVMTVKIKSSNPDFDGREVLVTIATAKNDGLSRVENIVFSDDRGTSFLTQRNPISWGLLTTKPLEYFSQVPQFVRDNPTLPEYGNYVDIRPLMQNNPLIKEFRKLQSS